MRFGIIAALAAEAAAFAAPAGRLLDSDDYVVAVSGPGRENAARTANRLVMDGCDVLLAWGLAGGLDPALAAGDLIVATTVIPGAGEPLAVDAAIARALAARLAGTRLRTSGTLLTLAEPVLAARDKVHLRERFAADAVDLESSAIASVARSAGRRFAGVRCIVDPAAFDVPALALSGLDADGTLHPLRTVAGALREPRQVPALIALLRHYRTASTALRAAARRLC